MSSVSCIWLAGLDVIFALESQFLHMKQRLLLPGSCSTSLMQWWRGGGPLSTTTRLGSTGQQTGLIQTECCVEKNTYSQFDMPSTFEMQPVLAFRRAVPADASCVCSGNRCSQFKGSTVSVSLDPQNSVQDNSVIYLWLHTSDCDWASKDGYVS